MFDAAQSRHGRADVAHRRHEGRARQGRHRGAARSARAASSGPRSSCSTSSRPRTRSASTRPQEAERLLAISIDLRAPGPDRPAARRCPGTADAADADSGHPNRQPVGAPLRGALSSSGLRKRPLAGVTIDVASRVCRVHLQLAASCTTSMKSRRCTCACGGFARRAIHRLPGARRAPCGRVGGHVPATAWKSAGVDSRRQAAALADGWTRTLFSCQRRLAV